jgi:hypothetical protein
MRSGRLALTPPSVPNPRDIPHIDDCDLSFRRSVMGAKAFACVLLLCHAEQPSMS